MESVPDDVKELMAQYAPMFGMSWKAEVLQPADRQGGMHPAAGAVASPEEMVDTDLLKHVVCPAGGTIVSPDDDVSEDMLKDVCLPLCFRCYGIPVPLTTSGPFWIIKDGNAMLRPFGYCVLPVLRAELQHEGKYIVHKDNHFYNVDVHGGDGGTCAKADGPHREFLQPAADKLGRLKQTK